MPRYTHAGALLLVGLLAAGCDGSPTFVEENDLDCDRVRSYSIGSAVSGSLSTTDCRLSDGAAVDYYRVRISGERDVRVTMTSNAVDSYVVILDSRGALVAEETEGGYGLSELVAYLRSGTYYIAATSYEDRDYGSYRLVSRYE
jgi:hypothetical protein